MWCKYKIYSTEDLRIVSLYIPSILLPLLLLFVEAFLVDEVGVAEPPLEPVLQFRQAGIKYFKASNSRLIFILRLFSIIECNCLVSFLRFANSSESIFAVDLRLFSYLVDLIRFWWCRKPLLWGRRN